MAATVAGPRDPARRSCRLMTLRILLTSETYLPYLSGVTVSVDALARGLGARGHEVMVVAPRPSRGDAPERAGSPGPAPRYAWVPSYALPRIAPPGHRMPWPVPWHAGWRAARRFAPDVVHAHSPFVSGVMARGVARSSGAPLVFTHHTRFGDYMHYLGPFAIPGRAVTNAWLRAWWRSCAAIVAPSEDLAASIRAQLGGRQSDAVHVVPTGVDVAGIRSLDPPDVRAMAGWPADAVVVASLGRLAPEKSPVLLVDALGHAARTDPHLRLLVVGGGPLLGRLRERTRGQHPRSFVVHRPVATTRSIGRRGGCRPLHLHIAIRDAGARAGRGAQCGSAGRGDRWPRRPRLGP